MMKRLSILICGFVLWATAAQAIQFGAGTGSSYPSALDTSITLTNKGGGTCTQSGNTSKACAETWNDIQSAVVAIQTSLSTGSFNSTARTISALWTFSASPGIDLNGTAPSFTLTDTTASAKSLTIAVDANLAQLRESAGASGSLMVLDLANKRVGVGVSPGYTVDIGTGTVQGSRFFGTTAVKLDAGGYGVTQIGASIGDWEATGPMVNMASSSVDSTSGNRQMVRIDASFVPASGTANFLALHINPTVNGTSSGTATAAAIASKTNTLTGGTIKLLDVGTTTTDYFTGYTSKFLIDVSGNVRAAGNISSNANGVSDLGTSTLGFKRLYMDYTNTATIGAVTINKASFRANIAAAATSVVVTNSLVTAASKVLCVAAQNDTTGRVTATVPGAGTVTIHSIATTADMAVDCLVVSAD